MLNVEENERLTRVGRGTPMGELMRRYWHPVAAVGEMNERPTKALRILGEDLVLYKDRSGTLGLIGRLCPHRRVDLSYGIPEEHGLRCMYHGWMMDETGQCIEQPFEETVHPDGRFKEKVKIDAYPVQELAGLIFAYMGPLPAPALPEWPHLTMENAVRDIAISHLPCNWLQCQENSLDAVHTEWLHGYYGNYMRRGLAERPKGQTTTVKIGFDVFEYGIIKRRLQEGFPEEGEDWTTGHPSVFPNILLTGDYARATMQWKVPVDDENTLHISLYTLRPAPGNEVPKQDVVPHRHTPLYEEDGRFTTNITFNQDYMAWITQGPIAEREKEVLGESDVGIILYRRLLKQQLAVVEDGGDPINVFRDPAKAKAIVLPQEHIKHGNLPDGRYRPGEAGESPGEEVLRQVSATWADVYKGQESPASPTGI
ncbi:MAG: aromatic ring-hydroxylating dioxygenase subunit alpha [Dehalococcoidia bacterium]